MEDELHPQKDLIEKVSTENIDNTQMANGLLNRQQAEKFLDLVHDYSRLLKKVREVRRNHPSGEINRLDLNEVVTEGADAGTTSFLTSAPTPDTVQYDMKKYRAGYNLYTDTEEDNIERGKFRATIAKQFAKAVAIDRENAAINGDDSLTTGDAQSRSNNLLGVNDGYAQILLDNVPAAQQIDAAGKGPSKALYLDMKEAIPNRYLGALGALDEEGDPYVFVVSPTVENLWREEVSGRATVIGDKALEGYLPTPWGIPLFMVPLMPQNLTYGTALSDCTYIWLTPLKNLILFVQRKITWESERKPRLDRTEFTMHYRCDFQVEEPEKVVIAKNVSLSGTAYS